MRIFGASVGRNVHICPSVKITIPWNLTIEDDVGIGDSAILYALGPIRIGKRTTISQYAHICAGSHDYHDPDMPLLKLPIQIGCDVWICADAFVGPEVAVGDRAIVGARAVVIRDVPENAVVVGNPARKVHDRCSSLPER